MNLFVSEPSFWVPELMVSSGWIEHAPFAFWLMEKTSPRTLVELGTHQGYSYFVFDQALKSLGTKTRCFAVDTWKGDEHSGYYGDDIFERVREYNEKHYWDFSELIRSTFDGAIDRFEDGTIDVLHIDGRHFYEDVKRDFETWRPKVSKRGIVIFHDTNVRVKGFGVYDLWRELEERHPHFEFLHGHGLGILGIGAEFPEALIPLFQASENEATQKQVRQVYSRLGAALFDRMELESDRGNLSGLASHSAGREHLEQQLSESEAERGRLAAELLQTTAERDQIWTEKKSFEAALGRSTEEGQRLEAERERLMLELSRSRTEAEQLQTDFERRKAAQENVASELVERKARQEELESQLVKQNSARAALELALTEQRTSEAKLKSALVESQFERDRLVGNVADALADRQRATNSLLRQEGQLNRMLASFSWRITAPLRWAAQKVPWARFIVLLPFRILWWTLTFQLFRRTQLITESRAVLRSKLFDYSFYLEQNPDITSSGADPLEHFLTHGGLTGCDPHPLFDSDWYLTHNPDVARSGINPLIHYLAKGRSEGRAPHPLFDPTFYHEQSGDILEAGNDLLEHYINRGGFEGFDPHPLFDSDWYLQQNTDVARSGINPLVHYVRQGWKERRNPHPLFDVAFYQSKHPNAASEVAEPLQHYLSMGGTERLDPHPLFDSDWYLSQNPDSARSGVNPLIHYVREGWKAGCDPHPAFESAYYQAQNPEVSRTRANPLQHFLTRGSFEGGDPHHLFNIAFYMEQNPGLKTTGDNPLVHYLMSGVVEGRDPNSFLDTSFYLAQYPDVADAGIDPLIHYARFGNREGRSPNSWAMKHFVDPLPTVRGQEEWDKYGRNRLASFLSGKQDLIFPSPDSPELSIVLVFHNKAHLSLLCLESLLSNADVNYEVVIVDNNSNDDTEALLHRFKLAKIIRCSENTGFSKACVIGASKSKGRYLLFLNNDSLLWPMSLAAALENFADDTVGAVGGKILLANGELQEAGSIIWSDGSAHGYGRLEEPDLPKYNFKRPVDYCSAAFLFTRRTLFNELEGFDAMYAPAYYEDTDYCMKVWESGRRVIYDPRCTIRHFESASSGGNDLARPLMEANQHKFISRWKKRLSKHCAPSMNHVFEARFANRSKTLKILYLDDRIPHRFLGAGFPRSNDILHNLVRNGYQVTCAAMRFPLGSMENEYRDVPREVELLDGRNSGQLFREYVPRADVVWISRPHNLASFLDDVTEFGGLSAKIVFDAEAIFTDREELCVRQRQLVVPSAVFNARLTRELALSKAADAVVVVAARDEEVMKAAGIRNVHILSHGLTPRPTTASFHDRKTFLFIGAMHGADNPNADSMRYFCKEIWPDVHRRTGAELVIAGFGTDSSMNGVRQPGLRLLGPVEDLTSTYNEARVFIAPTRYAAGIPFKIHEAAALGVPAVVSELIGQQLGWESGREILIARDAMAFSDSCLALYTDQNLWEGLRSNVLSRVRSELDVTRFEEKVSEILTSIEVQTLAEV